MFGIIKRERYRGFGFYCSEVRERAVTRQMAEACLSWLPQVPLLPVLLVCPLLSPSLAVSKSVPYLELC